MNYRRGIQRVYAVVAACWVGFWVVMALVSVPNNHQDPEGQLIQLMTAAIVPVLLAYILIFFVVPWITKGFKS